MQSSAFFQTLFSLFLPTTDSMDFKANYLFAQFECIWHRYTYLFALARFPQYEEETKEKTLNCVMDIPVYSVQGHEFKRIS